jgi:hypothetical protein
MGNKKKVGRRRSIYAKKVVPKIPSSVNEVRDSSPCKETSSKVKLSTNFEFYDVRGIIIGEH